MPIKIFSPRRKPSRLTFRLLGGEFGQFETGGPDPLAHVRSKIPDVIGLTKMPEPTGWISDVEIGLEQTMPFQRLAMGEIALSLGGSPKKTQTDVLAAVIAGDGKPLVPDE